MILGVANLVVLAVSALFGVWKPLAIVLGVGVLWACLLWLNEQYAKYRESRLVLDIRKSIKNRRERAA